jgi:hypothetical protein
LFARDLDDCFSGDFENFLLSKFIPKSLENRSEDSCFNLAARQHANLIQFDVAVHRLILLLGLTAYLVSLSLSLRVLSALSG